MTTPSSAEIAAMMRLAIAAITKAPESVSVRVWCVRVGDEACGAGPVRPKRLTVPVTASGR